MTSLTDLIVSLINTNFDTSLRTALNQKPAVFNVVKFGNRSYPQTNRASIAIYPHHIKLITESGDGWRNWQIANKVDIISYISEADAEDIVNAVREVLDNHQVTTAWKHWLDDEINLSDGRVVSKWKFSATIYSMEEETF